MYIWNAYTSDNIPERHIEGFILFKHSNVSNLKVPVQCVFELGGCCLLSSTILTSSRMHGNVFTEDKYVELKLVTSIDIGNKAPSKTIYNVCFTCSVLNDRGRFEKGHGLAAGATTVPGAAPWSILTPKRYIFSRNTCVQIITCQEWLCLVRCQSVWNIIHRLSRGWASKMILSSLLACRKFSYTYNCDITDKLYGVYW